MTYRPIDPGLAELLGLALDHQLPKKVEMWKQHLAKGRVSAEMRDVFAALGWLSSQRDRRLGEPTEEDEPEVKIDPEAKPERVRIREPKPEPEPEPVEAG